LPLSFCFFGDKNVKKGAPDVPRSPPLCVYHGLVSGFFYTSSLGGTLFKTRGIGEAQAPPGSPRSVLKPELAALVSAVFTGVLGFFLGS
jgi:hypothetical protein